MVLKMNGAIKKIDSRAKRKGRLAQMSVHGSCDAELLTQWFLTGAVP